MELKKCIGIVSYFPEEQDKRTQRIARFESLLVKINNLWPYLDILIVAQNWKDYSPVKIQNKLIIYNYNEPLTIVGARNTLRQKFLDETDYDYIIFLDDDAKINDCQQEVANQYLDEIDNHPNMFCFIHDKDHWHKCDDYIRAPLNLCAISRFIYEKEPIPPVYLEKNEALEDDTYAVLLHLKYPEYEFIPPVGIKCEHAANGIYYFLQLSGKGTPSTWFTRRSNFMQICHNTNIIIDYIVKNKDFNKEEIIKDKLWNNLWK